MAEIKNLKKTAKRILSAIKKKERIILYSDADLDGTVALLILEESIKNLEGDISTCYFPDREEEGYGLSPKALDFLQSKSPALLIITDCGISNFKEIDRAQKMGFETIIIDHHEILNKLPNAFLIVDPKQKGDKYPFKFLASAGLSFKLSKVLLGKKISKKIEKGFLELVALATIADMMPQIDDNRVFIERGLKGLPATFRPGLRAFFKFFPPSDFSLTELAQKIISVIKITGIDNHLTESYLLLNSQNEKEAEKIIAYLIEENSQRKEVLRELQQELEKEIKDDSVIVFEGGPQISNNLTGSLASRICNKFKKPTFIYYSDEKLSRGSVRTPRKINGVEVLGHCCELLQVYGGHPPACGFTVLNENLGKLKECLEKYFLNLKS